MNVGSSSRHRRSVFWLGAVLAVAAVSCGGKIKAEKSGSSLAQDAAIAEEDASLEDASAVVDGATDASTDASFDLDSSIADSGNSDSGVTVADSGITDSGVVDSGVVDSGVFVPPACTSIAGDWIWIEQSFTGTGCAEPDCGHDGLPICTTTTLMTASLPSPGKIRWSGMVYAGVSSDFDGTLQSNGMFSVAHTLLNGNTIDGSIDADCNLAARATVSIGGCNAVVDFTGFTL